MSKNNITAESTLNHVEKLLELDTESPIESTDELMTRIIDLSKDEPDIQFLFEKNDIGCIPVGDISVIKGKQKAGKSTVMAIWITALLTGEFMGFKAIKQGLTVMYIDTEQNPANTRRLTKKVHRLCGFSTLNNNPKFVVINLRGESPKDRNRLIDKAVDRYKIDFLILDGAKDLISNGDINDNKSCGETIQRMMTISKENNLAIVTILHENKNDSNLRGVIGTELLNKCAESWQVTKDGDMFDVEQLDCRNQQVDGFSFTLDDSTLPIPLEREPKIPIKERTEAKKIETFRQCLPAMKSLLYSPLKDLYSQYYPCGIETAKKDISAYLKKGYLIHQPDATYKFNYQKT